MPKWDKTRNYYADLEVQPNSSQDEIKKQYRKLALKWHPDRNPGKEADVSPRFQAIQTAHEILSDERMKKEYDEARGSVKSRYPASSGVRGNPWSNVATNFPPPPTRRNQGPARDRPASGASRYAGFANGATPRASRPAPNEDTQSRRSNFEAWNNMRSGSRAKPQAPPPTPGRAPTSATRESNKQSTNSAPPPPPRSASQRQKAEAAFGHTNRRSGYFPRSPGLGDEPPVTNKNYFTSRHHPQANDESTSAEDVAEDTDEPPSTPDRRPQSNINPIPDPLAQFREKNNDSRQRTPYTTHGGERMSLFDEGSGLGRSASTRVPPRRKEVPNTYSPQRPRSSSTPRSSNNEGDSEDSTRVNVGESGSPGQGSSHTQSAYSAFHSRASRKYTPNGAVPSPTSSTVDDHDSTGAKASSTQQDSVRTKYDTPLPRTFFSFHTSLPDLSPETRRSKLANSSNFPGHSVVSDIPPARTDGTARLNRSRPSNEPSLGRHLNNITAEMETIRNLRPRHSVARVSEASADQNCSTSFNFMPENSQRDMNTNRFASKSADSINVKFGENDQAGGYQFTAGGPSTDTETTPTKPRSQSGGSLGRRGTTSSHAPPFGHASSGGPEDDFNQTRFSAGEWTEKIGSQHFVPQPSRGDSSSPTRRNNSKKPKPIKKTVGSAGIIDTEENDDEDDWQEVPRTEPGTTPLGTDSMDIDTPPPEKEEIPLKMPQNVNGVRNIPVEPTRPDWRAGNVDTTQHKTPDSTVDGGSVPGPPGSNPLAVPQFSPAVGGSEDSEEFRTTLSDLKKTEPFADVKPSGLNTFADMQSTLPFQSQPSEHIPVERERVAVPLAFPTPPVAPRRPPTVAVPSIRPNMAQWRKYCQDFYNYMDKWQAFNSKVVEHFATRQSDFTQRRDTRGPAWLDTASGVDDYLVEIQQDQDVRHRWNQACDDHKERIREFVEFRDRVK